MNLKAQKNHRINSFIAICKLDLLKRDVEKWEMSDLKKGYFGNHEISSSILEFGLGAYAS